MTQTTPVTQSRWKSWAFWTSVIVAFVGFCTALGVWDWIGVPVDTVTKIVTAFIAFGGVIFGAANNPTVKGKF